MQRSRHNARILRGLASPPLVLFPTSSPPPPPASSLPPPPRTPPAGGSRPPPSRVRCAPWRPPSWCSPSPVRRSGRWPSTSSSPPFTARAVVHRALITDSQNKRRGTASTLIRGEVSGGGRKPYQQQKTGKVRRRSMRTPLRPGGGVIFGPKPRHWSIKINRKEKRLAISTALASAAVAEYAFVMEEFAAGPRTSDFVAALQRGVGLDPKQKAMFFATEFTDNVRLSGRNIGSLTPRTLPDAGKHFFTQATIDYLNSRYGAAVFDKYDDDIDGEDDGEETRWSQRKKKAPQRSSRYIAMHEHFPVLIATCHLIISVLGMREVS